MSRTFSRRHPARSAQRGQSMIEWIVVVAFTVIVLIEGGSSSPVQQVVSAIKDAYGGFTFSLSLATNLNAF